jgi:hypothetical protein
MAWRAHDPGALARYFARSCLRMLPAALQFATSATCFLRDLATRLAYTCVHAAFRPWTGAACVLIQADGDVWRRPSWLVAWGELPESGRVEVLRTDGQVLELSMVLRVRGLRMNRPR